MFQGVLTKMTTENSSPIRYYLRMRTHFLELNKCIGKTLQIDLEGYECLQCGLEKEIYRQGFCKSCFFETPAAGEWIVRPELSKAHLGKADRDLAYEEKMQLQPHIVYLALSSDVKVGVTRKSQVPTRWIDQGAYQAIPLLETPNRYLAGVAEVALKDFFPDKTNWRKMLITPPQDVDWQALKEKAKNHLPDDLKPYAATTDAVTSLEFPVKGNLPDKVSSLNLSKTPHFEGVLQGVKGQYLIFEGGVVWNVRSHEGTVIRLSFHSQQ